MTRKKSRQPGGVGHSVVPGEATIELRVRVAESHLDMLDELVAWGHARDRSAATRRAIEGMHRAANRTRSK